jgi:hypothetical protein
VTGTGVQLSSVGHLKGKAIVGPMAQSSETAVDGKLP